MNKFSSIDIPVEKRPSTKVKIGRTWHVFTAPKKDAWLETLELLGEHDNLVELSLKTDRTDEEEAELQRLRDTIPYDVVMTAAVTGLEQTVDGRSYVRGGFLRRGLGPEAWQKVYDEWQDDLSDVDGDYLLLVTTALQAEFSEWFQNKLLGTPGLPAPEGPKKRSRSKSST